MRSSIVVKVDGLLGAFQPLERVVEALSDVETRRARRVNLVLLVRYLHAFQVFLVHLTHILVDQYLLLHQVSQIQLLFLINLRACFARYKFLVSPTRALFLLGASRRSPSTVVHGKGGGRVGLLVKLSVCHHCIA